MTSKMRVTNESENSTDVFVVEVDGMLVRLSPGESMSFHPGTQFVAKGSQVAEVDVTKLKQVMEMPMSSEVKAAIMDLFHAGQYVGSPAAGSARDVAQGNSEEFPPNG